MQEVFSAFGWTLDSVGYLAGMMRFPLTKNFKSKPPTEGELISASDVIYSIDDFLKFKDEKMVNESLTKVFNTSPKGSAWRIVENCRAVRELKENPNSVSEPLWMAAGSNIAPCPDGRDVFHELSKLYDNYSFYETEKKYQHLKSAIIADRGMNSKENLVFLSDKNHHFIISYTLKKCGTALKEECLTGTWDYIEKTDDGEILYATKVLDTTVSAKVLMSEEERETIKKERQEQGIKGATPKYKNVEVDAKLHVSYSSKRAIKDASDRERAVAKAKKKIAEGTAIQSLKYGSNKYFTTDNDLKITGIDEEKIKEEAKWDGYYAVITDNVEVMGLYCTQWKIEECFRILKTDLEAKPVRVFKDEYIKCHFVLCYLALCVIRYIQYIMRTDNKTYISAQRIMDAIAGPKVVALGIYPKMIMVPQNLNEDFLFLIEKLGFKKLDSEMSITKFRATTKLDLNPLLKALIQ